MYNIPILKSAAALVYKYICRQSITILPCDCDQSAFERVPPRCYSMLGRVRGNRLIYMDYGLWALFVHSIHADSGLSLMTHDDRIDTIGM